MLLFISPLTPDYPHYPLPTPRTQKRVPLSPCQHIKRTRMHRAAPPSQMVQGKRLYLPTLDINDKTCAG